MKNKINNLILTVLIISMANLLTTISYKNELGIGTGAVYLLFTFLWSVLTVGSLLLMLKEQHKPQSNLNPERTEE